MTITLIRHGKTSANEKKLYCGHTDLDLSETGINELLSLKETVNYPPADVYAATGLKRTVSTLNILFGARKYTTVPELMEYNFGDYEMKTHGELQNEPGYIEWISDEAVRCPNGESRKEFLTRIETGFAKLKAISERERGRLGEAARVTCVCHGGVVASLMEALFPGKRGFYEWQPGFGRGYAVSFGADINYKII